MQREARISKAIMAALRQEGCFCWKVWGNEFTMAGLPDIVGVVAGKFFGIETKVPEQRANVSRIQAYRHEQIRKAGGAVQVCCSVKEAKAFIERVRKSIDT